MENRITIRKWFWVWSFEKEEDWLNEMAMNGWVLDGVGYCTYHFVRCEPGEYSVRLEMHPYDEAYLSFMRETGAEFVGQMMMWIYFRKKTADGPFDLFSDIDSRIRHLNTIGRFLAAIGGANLALGIVNSLSPSRLGWVNLLAATLLMYALGRIHGKKEALEKDRLLHE
ncbi:MAG: DUF2812 domain-containing protein [Oscillospiraceae bacterium]|nr:DUF2812 domain-containing protein [Oscillospiraceae bacterium]